MAESKGDPCKQDVEMTAGFVRGGAEVRRTFSTPHLPRFLDGRLNDRLSQRTMWVGTMETAGISR